MSQFTRDELFELAPMHALGATTPDEAAAMEAAMRDDAALAAEVASFRDVPATLATGSPVAPSAAVREALLAVAKATPQDRVPTSIHAPKAVPSVRGAPHGAPRGVPRWVPALMAASLVIAVGAVADNVRVRRDVASAQDDNARLLAQLQARESTLNAVLLGERELYLVQIGDPAEAQGPGMQFFWNAKEGKAVAHAFRLPPAPEGRDYQIWALVDGRPVSLVVFNSSADGHALLDVAGLASDVRRVTDILISVEPRGGSPQPTTTPFLGGKFPKV
jgi:anti-sigma-K factor RskA